MKSCLILGCGRSGTSMATGVLQPAGYYMGSRLISADEGNPKGYFEDVEVNAVNEHLLAQVLPRRPAGPLGRRLFRSRLTDGQRWLARLPLDTDIPSPPALQARIAALTSKTPFCFKDPRFSYTLRAWRPFLQDTVFVCVFRHPLATARSIVKEVLRDPTYRDLTVTIEDAQELWKSMYTHILQRHLADGGDWLFLHYEQFLSGEANDKLGAALGVSVDAEFVDPALRRSNDSGTIGEPLASLYTRLCALASFEGRAG